MTETFEDTPRRWMEGAEFRPEPENGDLAAYRESVDWFVTRAEAGVFLEKARKTCGDPIGLAAFLAETDAADEGPFLIPPTPGVPNSHRWVSRKEYIEHLRGLPVRISGRVKKNRD